MKATCHSKPRVTIRAAACAKCGHEFHLGTIRQCPYSMTGRYVCRYCCMRCRYCIRTPLGEQCGYMGEE